MSTDKGSGSATSFAQQRLWFFDQLNPGSTLYNEPIAIRLSGPLNVAALSGAFNEIVRRHEVLRTTFQVVDGEPFQFIAPPRQLALPIEDLSPLGPDIAETQARLSIEAQAWAPFDLHSGPLVRAHLIKLNPTEHILLFTAHHIAADYWSLGIMRRELAMLYAAFSQGQPSPLPDLPAQYADFAQWQRAQAGSAAMAHQLDHWRRRLADAPALLNLPTDRPRPASQTYRGATHETFLPAATVQGVHAIARKANATPYMALVATFSVLLHRHCGQSDICIGTPVANRAQQKFESLIGFFINLLALRLDLRGNPSFAELLQRARHATLEALDHQDAPFEQVLHALKVERNRRHAPLFQVVCILQSEPAQRLELAGLTLHDVEVARHTTPFDLTLEMTPRNGGLLARFKYNTDLFDGATIGRMAGHFEQLLAGVVAAPDARISELPMLRAEERQQLLVEWNNTASDYPKTQTVHQLFEVQAARSPDAIAVTFRDARLTYAELNAKANALAHHLRGHGVGPDVLVGLCVERSLHMVVGMLGILKAGGAYVPLDPAYPSGRLADLLSDAKPVLLLTQQHLLAGLPFGEIPTFCLDTQQVPADRASDNPRSAALPGNLAHVLYTSGSTGRPKGVGITHAAVNRLVFDSNCVRRQAGDGAAQTAGIAFDASTFEIWSALLHGCRLCVIPHETLLSPQDFADELQRQDIKTLFVTTALFNQFAIHAPGIFNRLSDVQFGGEAIDPRSVEAVLRGGAPQRLLHLYGPTEGTVVALWHQIKNVPENAVTLPLGRPIANTQVYLLDASLNPVPAGVAGEVYIAGDGLARGYLNRPGLTAEKFIPHPFSPIPGARLYKSGDLARYLPDGNIEFLGRIDHQLKIRGFRVEPGEVEAALRALPAVSEAVVLGHQDLRGEKCLAAYMVLNGHATAASIRAGLALSLPQHMIPAHFMFLDHLPLTPNGKLNRQALPAPSGESAHEAYQPPSTQTETALVKVWAELLAIAEDKISAHDNFFSLGGHSLLAVRLAVRVQEAISVKLPVRDIFEFPVLEQLAAAIDAVAPPAQAEPQSQRVAPVPRTQALPLSFAQQRLWFIHEHVAQQQTAYNMAASLHMHGTLNIPALRSAFHALIARHESLRTTFMHSQEQAWSDVVQRVSPAATLELPVIDVSASEVAQHESAHALHVFDLRTGPLLKATLLRLGPQTHVLLLNIHHIVCDGWSVGVMARDLQHFYAAEVGQAVRPLPALPIQCADHAWWQQQQDLRPHLAYWTAALAGYEGGLALPADSPRTAPQAWRAASLTYRYPAALAAGVCAFSRAHQASLFMTLTAALLVVLNRYTRRTDLCVGTTVAGRDALELENLIGFFVNILPLRVDLSADPSGLDIVRRVKSATLQGLEHQALPFEHLLNELQLTRGSNESLVPVMVRHQNFPPAALEAWANDLQARLLPMPPSSAKCELDLQFLGDGDTLEVRVEYAADLFNSTTVQRLLHHHQQVLEELVAAPQRRLSAFSVLTEAEWRLVCKGNATGRTLQTHECVPQLFERQAAATPQAVACIDAAGPLSYAALNAKANQVAHALRERGVGPEVRVGLCAARGADLLVGLLGIFKAGGAHVPLDPQHPSAYRRQIVADAQPRLLLASQDSVESAAALQSDETDVLCVTASEVLSQPQTNLPPVCLPAHLACVMYTSGSTGRPKGVMVPHLQILNWLQSLWRTMPFESGEIVAQKTTSTFAVSTKELLAGLLSGVAQTFIADTVVKDPKAFLDALGRERITRLNIVPSHLQSLLQHVGGNLHALRSLRHCVTAGEPLTRTLRSEMRARLPWVRLWNNYGCTELNDVTYHDACGDDAQRGATVVPIGRPIANTRVYVLDDALRPVPVGVAGELCVDSVGIARGYWRQPRLTAERFVPHPFSEQPGARLYKTGDLVRWLEDGSLEYLGREDFEIKIRGNRVDVREVEGALIAQGAIAQAAVGKSSSDGEAPQLAAWYVAAEAAPTPGELRAYLSDRLPAYMVPSLYLKLEALPRLPNGKLNRRALPKPDAPLLHTQAYRAPQTPTERTLATTWSAVLAVKPEAIGLDDDFFTLGGHSLRAAQLAAHILQEFSKDFSVRDIFQHAVLHDMASAIDRLAPVHTLAPLRPRPCRNEPVPLSFAQRPLWFIDQHMQDQQAAYHIPIAMTLHGPLDEDALRHAFNALIKRHEILRTSFQTNDAEPSNEPVQVIADDWAADMVVREVAAADVEKHVSAHFGTPFHLGKGPLLKTMLLRLSAQEHMLLVNLHHIVADGCSLSVMARDLQHFYAARVANEDSALPPLPVQYADYAYWQRQQDLSLHLDYWKQALAGYGAGLALPCDFPRGARRTWRAATILLRYPAPLAERLWAFSRDHKVSVFMTLLAALSVVLGRYAQRSDLCVGTTVAGRQNAQLKELIGFFVNILVLRVDLSGNPTALDLVNRVREMSLQAYRHQALPFEHVLKTVPFEHDKSQAPLVPILARHQNFSNAPWEYLVSGVEIRKAPVPPAVARWELDFQFFGEDGAMEVCVEYAADLFKATTVERLLQHHLQALETLLAAPDRRLPQFNVLTAEELRLFDLTNATAYPLDTRWSIAQLFERQVRATPAAIACKCESGKGGPEALSFAQLNSWANQLAHALREKGVGPGTRVALYVPRSAAWLAGLLGTLKAGGVHVPLDVNWPTHYLRDILEDAQPHLIVTSRDAPCEWLDEQQWPRLSMDLGALAAYRQTDVASQSRPEHLACIAYTSGSTSRPKGVMVPHLQMLNWLQAMWRRMPFEAGEVVAQKTTVAFSVSMKELLAGLLAGVPQVFISEATVRDTEALVQTLYRERVSRLNMVPTHWQALLKQLGEQPERGDALRSLKHLMLSGEPLTRALLDDTRARLPWLRVWHVFGCTELNDISYCSPTALDDDGMFVSIGNPIANTRLYVLDADGQPVPIGVPGELCVDCIGMAQGYWGQAGATAERFTPHPFSDVPGARLYKTGDIVRRLDSGGIEYLGRKDFEIKVRGNRIDVRQVESALRAHPAVEETVVSVWHDAEQNAQMVAYCVLDRALASDGAALRSHLSTRLPAYMVPTLYVALDALPRLANGKLDRLSLPAPNMDLLHTSGRVAPRTQAERVLADIWADLLGLPAEKIGIEDDFFSLGGHSLLAAPVVSRLKESMGVNLPIKAVFEASCIRELALLVESAAPHPDTAPMRRRHAGANCGLSHFQKTLWLIDQADPGNRAYHMAMALQLNGALDLPRLEKAVNEIVRRHDALRTTFSISDGVPQQRIVPAMEIAIRELRTEQSAVRRLAEAEAAIPFDLQNGPLIRCTVAHLGEAEHVFIVAMHHIISDGWSYMVFFNELSHLYHGTHPLPLPEPALQYADYVEWQQSRLTATQRQTQLNYWKQQLAGMSARIDLPTDRPRPAVEDFAGASMPFSIDAQQTQALLALARDLQATPFMLLAAAFNVLLYRYSSQTDISIGMFIANRDRPEFANTIGALAEMLVLRTTMEGNPSFATVLAQVRRTAAAAFAHQDVSLAEIGQAIRPGCDAAPSSLVDVGFSFHNYPVDTSSAWRVSVGAARHALFLDMGFNGPTLWGAFEYRTNLFEHTTLARMIENFQTLLGNIVQAPQTAINELALEPGQPRRPG